MATWGTGVVGRTAGTVRRSSCISMVDSAVVVEEARWPARSCAGRRGPGGGVASAAVCRRSARRGPGWRRRRRAVAPRRSPTELAQRHVGGERTVDDVDDVDAVPLQPLGRVHSGQYEVVLVQVGRPREVARSRRAGRASGRRRSRRASATGRPRSTNRSRSPRRAACVGISGGQQRPQQVENTPRRARPPREPAGRGQARRAWRRAPYGSPPGPPRPYRHAAAGCQARAGRRTSSSRRGPWRGPIPSCSRSSRNQAISSSGLSSSRTRGDEVLDVRGFQELQTAVLDEGHASSGQLHLEQIAVVGGPHQNGLSLERPALLGARQESCPPPARASADASWQRTSRGRGPPSRSDRSRTTESVGGRSDRVGQRRGSAAGTGSCAPGTTVRGRR